MEVVMPALDAAKEKFPALGATVADTLDDIEMFTRLAESKSCSSPIQ
ncbi:hypothetical protein [Pseudomonas sp. NPDC096950]